tara:strand:+ start:1200 stop:1901 length:702 start_codon:yes stop_codon:yes gene_type:complete
MNFHEVPFEFKVDVDFPIHTAIKRIKADVVDPLKNLTESKIKELVSVDTEYWEKQGVDVYLLFAYPILLLAGQKISVENPKVKVVDVGTKGQGVVATNKIARNSIITFYPCDVIRIRCFDKNLCKEGLMAFFSPHKHWRDLFIDGFDSRLLDKYQFSIGNTDILGDPSLYSSGCCGHMVNGGDGPVKGTCNGMVVPLFGGAVLAIVAIVDIEPGTEVLIKYGESYWEDKRHFS